jgi:DNA helicase HerA-like ATPase
VSKPVNIEHPAAFYVGKEVSEPDGAPGRPVLLEAADLTTHAVCVGMTGSGKTGLGIGLLEEAALDGIPAIVIDPKGDLTNLLLTFPELRPADLAPWLNPDEAGRRNLTLEAYSEEVANRSGLPGSRRRPSFASIRPAAARACRSRSWVPRSPRRPG